MTRLERQRIARAAEAARENRQTIGVDFFKAAQNLLACISVRLLDVENRISRLERKLDA